MNLFEDIEFLNIPMFCSKNVSNHDVGCQFDHRHILLYVYGLIDHVIFWAVIVFQFIYIHNQKYFVTLLLKFINFYLIHPNLDTVVWLLNLKHWLSPAKVVMAHSLMQLWSQWPDCQLISQVQDGKPSTCFGWISHPIQYLRILRYLCVIFIVSFLYVFICHNFWSLALLMHDHVTLFLVFSDKMAENANSTLTTRVRKMVKKGSFIKFL